MRRVLPQITGSPVVVLVRPKGEEISVIPSVRVRFLSRVTSSQNKFRQCLYGDFLHNP